MDIEEVKEMEVILAAHSYKVVQAIPQVLKDLAFFGKTPEDLVDFLETRRQLLKDRIDGQKKCPECGRRMLLSPVNDHPSRQVGGSWKSQWRCSTCETEIYSNLPPNEEFQESLRHVRREGKNGNR